MRLRLSWLVRGAPAATIAQLAHAPRRTILGTSINVVAPVGEYSPEALINLGTNRWAFRPEFTVSQPIAQRWLPACHGRPSTWRTTWEVHDRAGRLGQRSPVQRARRGDRRAAVGRRHSIKIAASSGAIVRQGGDFTTFSFAWQTGWVHRPPTPAP